MKTNGAPEDVHILLFDVGGVLVQLSGVETMLRWMGQGASSDELWRMWLKSGAVRKFETGQIDEIEFSIAVTSEFGLSVEPQEFLQSFIGWPTGLYPGTLELLARIPHSYRRALLSNSNALHWPRVLNDMNLGPAFDSHFVSHITGRIKPDADAFEHALESLGCAPASVLFLDDNKINVEAAQNIGMHAVRVQGPVEVQSALMELGILSVNC
jgi:HAD superfamily hydrolase (TIGR01509 family)